VVTVLALDWRADAAVDAGRQPWRSNGRSLLIYMQDSAKVAGHALGCLNPCSCHRSACAHHNCKLPAQLHHGAVM
jgi:hypothetical protein